MQWMRAAFAAITLGACVHAHSAGLERLEVGSREARAFVHQVVARHDSRGLPFAVVDKRDAKLYLFDRRGRLQAATSVLVGQAPGDAIAENVGLHAQQGFVPFEERTTPAGRFVVEPGVNADGEHVLWLDWNAAFAIHRLRPGKAQQARLVRFASDRAEDKRVSWGCVIVPVAFYTGTLQDWASRGKAIVYVMPEHSGVAPDLARDRTQRADAESTTSPG